MAHTGTGILHETSQVLQCSKHCFGGSTEKQEMLSIQSSATEVRERLLRYIIRQDHKKHGHRKRVPVREGKKYNTTATQYPGTKMNTPAPYPATGAILSPRIIAVAPATARCTDGLDQRATLHRPAHLHGESDPDRAAFNHKPFPGNNGRQTQGGKYPCQTGMGASGPAEPEDKGIEPVIQGNRGNCRTVWSEA